MDRHPPIEATGWQAELALRYERRDARTVLAARRHAGPLQVQKPLYPEGAGVCHGIVLHPPGGIVGGDSLQIDAIAGPGAHALLTTPGAGKWYRSAGAEATQALHLRVDQGAVLEWLPQPAIVFDRARVRMACEVEVAAGGTWIGWDVLCFGRTASGERFRSGSVRMRTGVRLAGRTVWVERARIDGDGPVMHAPAGLASHTVCGTLLAVSTAVDARLVAACRAELPERRCAALTAVPGVLIARFLGDSSEAAHRWLARVWSVIRPRLAARPACPPRIWNT